MGKSQGATTEDRTVSGRTARWAPALTVQVDVSIGQGQQRRVQGVVRVAEDGVPLVNLLHHVGVQAVLLENREPAKASKLTQNTRVCKNKSLCILFS